jgi:hypothetical protein
MSTEPRPEISVVMNLMIGGCLPVMTPLQARSWLCTAVAHGWVMPCKSTVLACQDANVHIDTLRAAHVLYAACGRFCSVSVCSERLLPRTFLQFQRCFCRPTFGVTHTDTQLQSSSSCLL